MNEYLKMSAALFICMALVPGCAYHNEEDLYPVKPDCDTIQVTYIETIAPIMTASCNVCHNTVQAPNGIITDTYTGLRKSVDNQRLWGAVDHQQGYIPMPQETGKLSYCNLAKIRKWIDLGAPNH